MNSKNQGLKRAIGRKNMKKILTAAVILFAAVAVIAGCGGNAATQTTKAAAAATKVQAASSAAGTKAAETTQAKTQAPATKSAVTTAAATTKAAAAASKAAIKNVISGVVIDASMNVTTIQSEHGTTLSFSTGADTASVKIDRTGLKDSIVLGHAVKITCKDAVDEKNPSANVVTKMEDAKSKCEDYDALSAAGTIILMTENKDLNGLASVCSYPVYVGAKGGMTVKDQAEFLKNFTAADIFTDTFVKSVTGTNLMDIGISDAGMVVSANGAKPDVIISKTDDGWNITGINVN